MNTTNSIETGINRNMFYLCRGKLTSTPSTLCIKSNQSQFVKIPMNRMSASLKMFCIIQFTEEPFTKLLIHQKYASNNQLLRIRAAYYIFKSVCEIFFYNLGEMISF